MVQIFSIPFGLHTIQPYIAIGLKQKLQIQVASQNRSLRKDHF